MNRALVLGYGRSGKAAEALLRRLGHEVAVLDGEAKFPAGNFARAVVSPGVALTHPWIAECRARGVPPESELQLGCEELRRRGWKLLAVTGSKGKSSVVRIVADAINLAGRHAVPCGNYGLPVCEVALSDFPSRPSYAVVEVSSFMMETTDLPADAFEAAAILNLQEDHLDRHGSVETYHGLKRRLLSMAKKSFDLSDASARGDLAGLGETEFLAQSYFDNDILRANGVAAYRLMRAVEPEIDAATVRRAFAEFVPLPHRMNRIGEFDGVTYVDDSKATSLAALAAGVVMAASPTAGFSSRRIRLIAGGLPKGDDPNSVVSVLTGRVKKVYLIGQSAEVFHSVWNRAVDCEICGTMDRAVAAARREAAKGDIVLLSPGTASFDQFQSFGERGDVFAALVKNKDKEK